jgi:hypothetical protein
MSTTSFISQREVFTCPRPGLRFCRPSGQIGGHQQLRGGGSPLVNGPYGVARVGQGEAGVATRQRGSALRGGGPYMPRLCRHSGNGRYQRLHVLESLDRLYAPVILPRNSKWPIVAHVLWWIFLRLPSATERLQVRDWRGIMVFAGDCFFFRVILLRVPRVRPAENW